MIKNKEIAISWLQQRSLTPEQVQAEVDDLYAELSRRFGEGFADYLIGKYTDAKPKKKEVGAK